MLQKQSWLMLLFLILAIGQTIFAADNPFEEDQKRIEARIKSEPLVYSGPPEIQPGSKVIGIVDVTTSLNVRTSPWGDIIGTLGPNAQVTIVGQVGDWYKIEYQGRIAYVHSAHVRQPGEGPKPFPRTGWVNAPLGVKVRRVPYGDVIGTLKDQQEVEILGISGEFYKIKYGDNEAFVPRRAIDTKMPSEPSQGEIVKEEFIGYVSAPSGLNVRKAPWGPIETTLPYGIAVKVIGKVDDWYQISYNGKVRYVHENYIVRDRKDLTPENRKDDSNVTSSGSLQERIVAEARKLIGSTAFRTKDVDYGNKACAKVVSTALVNAGAIPSVVVNVRTLVDILHKHGWKEVNAPPFKEGDVITWKTYDYTGDGIKDPDTHVGIMVKQNGVFKAMNNSSRLRTPRYSDPYSVGPITRVLRKV